MSEPFKVPTLEELKVLISWPAGTAGERKETELIYALLELGKRYGFGRVQQLAGQIEDIWRQPSYLAQYAAQAAYHRDQVAKDQAQLPLP